jgi:hypothetical protein
MSDELLPELWDLILANIGYDGARRCFLVCRAWMRVFVDPNSRGWRAIFVQTGALRPAWRACNWREAARAREPKQMIDNRSSSPLLDVARVREIRDRGKAKLGAWVNVFAGLKRFDDQTRHAFAQFVTSIEIEFVFRGPSGFSTWMTACMADSILRTGVACYKTKKSAPPPGLKDEIGTLFTSWRGFSPATTMAFPPIEEEHENQRHIFRAQPSIAGWTLRADGLPYTDVPGRGPDTIATRYVLFCLYFAVFLAFASGLTAAADDVERPFQRLVALLIEMAIRPEPNDAAKDKAECDAWRALVAD